MADRYPAPSELADDKAMEDVRRIEGEVGIGFSELGVTGLKRSAGYVDEEFLPQLRGRKAVQVYREMGDNDPITSAMLFTLTQLLRGVDWKVVPAGKSKDDVAAAKLVETCMQDMSSSWDDVIQEILTCLQYGWSWHEVVYKRRMGPWQKDPRHRSKYSDGLVGWRKMPIRAQETLQRWVFDEAGDVQAMIQLSPPDYKTRTMPISSSLLFRAGHHKGNPEGRSILRGSYRPWYYKKRLEEFESVGVERDLAGLPKVTVPADYLRAKAGTEQYKTVAAMKKMVRSIRRNEQEGLVFPAAFDADTKQPLFGFELMGGGSQRQFDTDKLIQRYEQRQLMTILADWIMVGHTGTGTYNMHVDKRGVFNQALKGVTMSISEVFNRHAIPRLFEKNGWKPATLPYIQAGLADNPDLSQLAQFLSATAALGFSWGPDPEMERFLRDAAGLPALGNAEQDKHRRLARMEESAVFAETQSRYLAARSQLAQAMATEQAMAAGEHTVESAQLAQQADQGNMANEAQAVTAEQTAETHAQGAESHAQQMQLASDTEGRATAGEKRAVSTHEFDQKQALKPEPKAKLAGQKTKTKAKAK